MPSSASSFLPPSASPADALAAVDAGARQAPSVAHFHVVPFRRDANGAIVPGTSMEVRNGDMAWRCARAAALDHRNVGAVELRDGVLLASFGDVNLDALPH